MKKILGLLTAALLLNACNSGTSGSTSDIQQGSGTITVNGSTFTINGFTATGCRTIPANGTCTLQLTGYNGSNSFAGPLTLSTLNGYISNIASCPAAQSNTLLPGNCTITITSTGSVSNAQTFGVIANGNSSSQLLSITIGGGI